MRYRSCRNGIASASRRDLAWFLAGVLAVIGTAGSQAAPQIGYIYPAGGQAGSTFEVKIGGQRLGDPIGVVATVDGITAEVIDHFRLLSAEDRDAVGELAQEVSNRLKGVQAGGNMTADQYRAEARKIMDQVGVTEKNLLQLREFSDRLSNPKRQQNSQIGETVTLKVKVAESVPPGLYYLRLQTASGLSNAMRFGVGQHPEVIENDPWPLDLVSYFGSGVKFEDVGNTTDRFDRVSIPLPTQSLPVTINGQIHPGEVDEFTFRAEKGDQVVVALHARKLVPYLADAVPGWFQAVISLHDSKDREIAFADDFRFDPDPVIFFKVPEDGEYRVKIYDSIYRGREDFVYRLTMGELPFLTGVSPQGAKAGSELDLTLQGGNLEERVWKRYTVPEASGLIDLVARKGSLASNAIPFHVETFEEAYERENNDRLGSLNEVVSPGIINGTISKPGDVDFFRVRGLRVKGMAFEIFARRLGSPLDATLTVYDERGKQAAFNDDFANPEAGLTTHHADSRVVAAVPGGGTIYVKVADSLNEGGVGYHYRLKVTPAVPRYALRVTPGSVTAAPSGAGRVTVHALRIDGYDGPISVRLKEGSPAGFQLNGVIPAGEEKADLSISVPPRPTEWPVPIQIEGVAQIDAQEVVVDAIPAEDMMQAFAYRHLVPVDALLVDVRVPPPPRPRRP